MGQTMSQFLTCASEMNHVRKSSLKMCCQRREHTLSLSLIFLLCVLVLRPPSGLFLLESMETFITFDMKRWTSFRRVATPAQQHQP